MELLAPAGTMENFIAALEAGADAIYLGGKQFNARSHADNFNSGDLSEAVRLAHLLGVQVHVTVNILIGDKEMEALSTYLQELERIGVDAIIVQDMAVAKLAKQVAPSLQLHCSTQLTATNLATVKFYEAMGFSRVVLSRELSLEDIRIICEGAKAEIEVFIHGALCVCYSGQCLMSSFIGGRSGNRGSCAQPCRLPYELVNESGQCVTPKHTPYLLSPKDLNYSEHIEELIQMGVASFKIEGRMKQAEYVHKVVGAYRHIIDAAGCVTNEDKYALQSAFNRGFSTAYLDGCVGKDMITAVAPNHRGKLIGHSTVHKGRLNLHLDEPIEKGTVLKIINESGHIGHYKLTDAWQKIDELRYTIVPDDKPIAGKIYTVSLPKSRKKRGLSEFSRKYAIYGYLQITDDNRTSLTYVLEDGVSVEVVHEFSPAIATHRPTSLEQVQSYLGRLGNTVFQLASISIPEGDYMWPASVLNELRRQAVAKLEESLLLRHEEKRLGHKERRNVYDYENNMYPLWKTVEKPILWHKKRPIISVRCDEIEQVKAAIAGGAKKILFGGERLYRRPYEDSIYQYIVEYCHDHDAIIVMSTPRVVKENEIPMICHTLANIIASQPDAISFHSPGILMLLQSLKYTGPIEADTGLNIFNREAASFYEAIGVTAITPSLEMTLQQITSLVDYVQIPIETIVHGRIEMMISEYCVIGSFLGASSKKTCMQPCLHGRYYLKDRKGELFPVYTDPYCRMHIMNGHVLDMRAYIPELIKRGISILRIEGRQETGDNLLSIVQSYVDIVEGRKLPPKKDLLDTKSTRGHYFRGIFEGN